MEDLRLAGNALPLREVPRRPCAPPGGDHMQGMSDGVLMSTADERLNRQFELISRQVPAAAGFFRWIRRPGMILVRLPVGVLLIVGGIFSFLPILGIWMLPLGLLFLAIDVPALKAPVGNAIVRFRRWWSLIRRKYRRR
jgi:hypothetical protein